MNWAVVFGLTVAAIFVWAGISDYLASKRKRREEDAEWDAAGQWLEEEKKKPKFRLLIIKKDFEEYRSNLFDPQIDRYWPWTSQKIVKYTSKEVAQTEAENIMKRTYCVHQDTTIPTCDIKHIKLEQENVSI